MASVPHLPVGLPTEPTAAWHLGRAFLFLGGAFLLVAGSRKPRTAAWVFAGAVSLPFALLCLGALPPIAAAPVWILATCLCAAILRSHPRVGSALTASWVGPAGYLMLLSAGGSFHLQVAIVLALLAAGVTLGAAAPRIGWALGISAAGTALAAAATGLRGVVVTATVVGTATAAQLFIPTLRGGPAVTPAARNLPREFGRAAALALCLATLALVVLVAATPAPPPKPGRYRRLVDAGGELPALVLRAPNAFWLTGRAARPAMVGVEHPLERLAALLRPAADLAVRRLRTTKEAEEVRAIRRAARSTAAAMEVASGMVRPGTTEAEIAAAVEAACRRHGAQALAFPSIVGAGAHATLPHWQRNDGTLTRGLVVVDIGCQVDGYAADMTRTFVISPPPTPEERELLDLVAEAKAAGEAVLGPGVTLGKVHRAAREVFERAGMERFFIHFVGHHVGIEVHDPGRSPLEPGMVVTVEPGLYIPAGSPVDRRYWNLGVRIEDTYLITRDGWERLTAPRDASAHSASTQPPPAQRERPGRTPAR